MLRSLHVRNYILINSLDISFPEGLVIITGQTGAGKSILLGALSLLSGSKADASMLSDGADSCVVEAEFEIHDAAVEELLRNEDVEFDGSNLIIRRVVSSSGRSRSFVNDCPVQVGLLQEVSERLIDIHSQHKSLILTDKSFQLSILDHFAGNSATLEQCRQAWAELGRIRTELKQTREKLERASEEQDFNESQFRQLEQAALKSGELEELEEEHKTLANAEQIKTSLMKAASAMEPESDDAGVLQLLRDVEKELSHISRFMPSSMEGLLSRVESARYELEDIAGELSSINNGIDVSAGRLEFVEERMSLLYSLLKKHHCSTIDELIARRDALSELLFDSSALEERISGLVSAEKKVYGEYKRHADALSERRKAVAASFAAEIENSLKSLEIERASFAVDVQQAPEGPCGTDKVTFLFSSTGLAPVDLARCASGGEMSRIMLCLKAMMARFTGMPTLIFDEIDTGVSGSVADKIGRMICQMGNDMQVLSITHLPQVAAKGKAHYVVSKAQDENGRTVSTVHKLSDEERVMEIARLLSGSVVTEAAINNARELLL